MVLYGKRINERYSRVLLKLKQEKSENRCESRFAYSTIPNVVAKVKRTEPQRAPPLKFRLTEESLKRLETGPSSLERFQVEDHCAPPLGAPPEPVEPVEIIVPVKKEPVEEYHSKLWWVNGLNIFFLVLMLSHPDPVGISCIVGTIGAMYSIVHYVTNIPQKELWVAVIFIANTVAGWGGHYWKYMTDKKQYREDVLMNQQNIIPIVGITFVTQLIWRRANTMHHLRIPATLSHTILTCWHFELGLVGWTMYFLIFVLNEVIPILCRCFWNFDEEL
jgi:hypothetical protein